MLLKLSLGGKRLQHRRARRKPAAKPGVGARTVEAVRWIVDAMNVIGSRPDGWWRDRRGAMVRLVDQLERWALATGQHVTVVFERPMRPPIRSAVIEIEQAPRAGANSADNEIVRLVRADGRPCELTVATSDLALIDRVRNAGAATHPAAGFRDVIAGHG